jgi:CDGSH-type Zn-finger protein
MCACGLSGTFPFCDSSQMIAKTNLNGQLVKCGAANRPELPAAEPPAP